MLEGRSINVQTKNITLATRMGFEPTREHHTGDEDRIFAPSSSQTPPSPPPQIMATAQIGTIEPFDTSANDWETYVARLEQFLEANGIANDKKVATLLTLIGGPTFQLLNNLVSPDNPKDKNLNELKDALKQHFSPAPLEIAERYRFHKRDQASGETVATYLAELRRLARYCNFGASLDTYLRDRLTCGLKNEGVIKKLLQEKNLTLQKAVEIASAMEIAARDAAELGKTAAPVHSLVRKPRPQSKVGTAPINSDTCFRCRRSGHRSADCKCKEMDCRKCGKRGHISRACPGHGSSGKSPSRNLRYDRGRKFSKTHTLEEEDASLYRTSTITGRANALMVEPKINGKAIRMELDTGSALSIVPECLYRQHLATTPLSPTSVVLKTYSGQRITPLGAITVHVDYNGQHHEGPVYVVRTDGPALFGRDWLRHIRVDWSNIHRLAQAQPFPSGQLSPSTQRRLNKLLERHAVVFGEDRGHLRHTKGHLHLVEGATPRFCKARPLPYALRDKVATELDRLEHDGILTKVSWSEWATPVVSVPKKDGSVRICGDFKVSLNKQLRVDQYPLPRVDDVFASLAGGQRFSKIDLRQAYLQMEMDDTSKKFLVLNTHKGLYRLNRLAFGIASAPALWQRAMDQLLQGTADTHCILDDILITGVDDEHHLANVKAVLQRLEDAGLRANRLKCSFMQPKIEYCGHEVSEDGLHKMPTKVDAICQAPVPQSVPQLRSFLGLVNYYAKFLPNLSTTLHPLNALLQKGIAWKWTTACNQAFECVKQQIASDRVLTHFNPKLPLRLASDASPYGIGAVMSHIMPNGEERPIAFASRTLSAAERNYTQIDKEALAIVWAVRKFHAYLYGRNFLLDTDHKPLTAIFHPEKDLPSMTAARLQRYALFLAGHRYTIVYRNTTEHANADGLSRLPLSSDAASHPVDIEVDAFHVAQIEQLPVTAKQIRTATRRFLLTYRTTPHATTRESPSILLHGRQLRTRLDLLRPNAARQVEEKQLAQASSHSSLTSPRQLDIGQSVIVRDYRPGRAPWIAGTIATRKGLHCEVEVSPGNLWRRHIDQLRSSGIAPTPINLDSSLTSAEGREEEEVEVKSQPSTGTSAEASTELTEASHSEPVENAAVDSQTESEKQDTGIDTSSERRYPQRQRKAPERFRY